MAGPRRRSKRPKYLVFVSHATKDKWLATALCEKLESVGATTFRDDRDIDGGDDIPHRIRAAIEKCDEMVVLLTPESVTRPWVLLEIGAAWQRGGMRIIAILQHVEIEPIPDMLKSKKVLNLNEFDNYLKELGQRIKAAQ
jgi:hypothetical protein